MEWTDVKQEQVGEWTSTVIVKPLESFCAPWPKIETPELRQLFLISGFQQNHIVLKQMTSSDSRITAVSHFIFLVFGIIATINNNTLRETAEVYEHVDIVEKSCERSGSFKVNRTYSEEKAKSILTVTILHFQEDHWDLQRKGYMS